MKESRKSKLIKAMVSGVAILVIVAAVVFAQEKPSVVIPLESGSMVEYYHLDVEKEGFKSYHIDLNGMVTFTDEQIMLYDSLSIGNGIFILGEEIEVNDPRSRMWECYEESRPNVALLIQVVDYLGVFVVGKGLTVIYITNKKVVDKDRLPVMNTWYELNR